jgi:hypothetical protein
MFASLSGLRGFGQSARLDDFTLALGVEKVMLDTTSGHNEVRSGWQSLQNKSVASVAQLVEQLTLNQLVLGSSPSRGTTLN